MSPKNILIVCLDNLGDLIMASALIEPIKKRYPSASVSLWVKDHFAGLFADDPLMQCVVGASPFWTASPNRIAGGFFKYISALIKILRLRFDFCLIVNSCWRKALSLIFIPKRLGVKQKKSGAFLSEAVSAGGASEHKSSVLLGMLGAMGIEKAELKPRIFYGAALDKYARDIGIQYGFKGKNVFGFQVYSGDKRKDSGGALYGRLAALLAEEYPDVKIAVFYGPGEREKIEEIFRAGTNAAVLNTSIPEMASLIKRSSLFFGPDSGPLHIAGAFGVPLIGFYSVFPSCVYKPLGSGVKAVWDCVPAAISAEEILGKIQMLENSWKSRVWE